MPVMRKTEVHWTERQLQVLRQMKSELREECFISERLGKSEEAIKTKWKYLNKEQQHAVLD